jgi:hypothetical protein
MLAAIAYVTEGNMLNFHKGDTLICDASDQAIRTGETSAAVLRKLFKAGVSIYCRENLHAKVLVFGKNVLIGSCNLSNASATSLREAALLTSRSLVRSQVVAFIHMVKNESQVMDEQFVDRISKIKVEKRHSKLIARIDRPQPFGNRSWIISSTEIDPDRYKNENMWINEAEKDVKKYLSDPESKVSWVRFVGKSRFREVAQEGDTIIVMSSVPDSRILSVSAPVSILKRQDQGKWTRFYYEEPDESSDMTWTMFERKLKKIGITSIKRTSTRELTKRNAALIDTIWECEE